MEATVRAICPQCRTALRIPAKWVGQAVKCKKCGALVRVKGRDDGPAPDDTAPSTPLPAAAPAPAANPFDFSESEHEEDDDFLGLSPPPAPAPAPVPVPMPAPVLDANGYPLPPGYAVPPGYPYAPPPGYPYPVPPAYPAPAPDGTAPAPGAAYPYPAPGYALPPGYAPPPGYPYPQPVPASAAAPAAAPAAAAPVQPTKPGGKPAPAKAKPAAKAAPAADNEFALDDERPARRGGGKRKQYRRKSGSGAFIVVGLCLVLTAALAGVGVFFGKSIALALGVVKKEEEPEVKGGDPAPQEIKGGAKVASAGFPRRLLFVSVSKYMYLNPLTASRDGIDLAKPAALRLAYDWRVPTEKDNNQVFILADTLVGPEARLPMKSVIQGTYREFFNTSRAQDRVAVYFGGHAIEKDGKAFIAPMEADPEAPESLIPLDQFYAEMAKCKAAQKIVIWDVCRYNPERGRVRPGSEPMGEALYKALGSPPAGVQAVVTCKPGENAMEFTALRPDGFAGAVYSGSSFLDAMKFVAEPRNGRMSKATPKPEDALPVDQWVPAVAKRTVEMSALAEKAGSGGKQTVALSGAAPANLAPPSGEEKAAVRFELPQSIKGASPAEIKSVEGEFALPPMKPGLASVALADFPFPADVMKPYADDGKDPKSDPFRAAVLESFEKVREKWTPGAGATKLRDSVQGPFDDNFKRSVKNEQEFWAVGIIELEAALDKLKAVADAREAQPKRWQAHYDFALASVKARLAYMNEYNKLMGNLITDTLPALDAKIGQDGYVLVSSETLKSAKDIKTLASEAQEAFEKITQDYKGTPWAIQAKQEKSVALGLNWKPASLKKGE
jgi:hypothetical protein